MSFATGIKSMDAHLIKTFGEPCTYQPIINGKAGEPFLLNAVIEYELSVYTQITDVVSGGVVITFLADEVPKPRNGDTLRDNSGNHWKILKPLESDDSITSVTAVLDHRAPELT